MLVGLPFSSGVAYHFEELDSVWYLEDTLSPKLPETSGLPFGTGEPAAHGQWWMWNSGGLDFLEASFLWEVSWLIYRDEN
jgi:hypothetical protein